MNELYTYIIHGLLATVLALAPLSVAAYFDVRSKREAERKKQSLVKKGNLSC